VCQVYTVATFGESDNSVVENQHPVCSRYYGLSDGSFGAIVHELIYNDKLNAILNI